MSQDAKTTSLYCDDWHRPHADHAGEVPTVAMDRGPQGLKVTLDQWGPEGTALAVLFNQAVSNWGEEPSRVRYDHELTDADLKVVDAILAGQHLSNAMEAISFSFTIEGCTRACTHELVRSRVGASFAQHGGRDNDWRHRRWTLPETVARLMDHEERKADLSARAAKHMQEFGYSAQADDPIHYALCMQKALYAAMVDSGIPWQDARRILGIGHQTYIHANYNLLALKGVTAHRLEHGAVDWEIDCVAQLMVRAVWLRCPRRIARILRSHSDASGVNKFATLYSWPPNGKHPVPTNWNPDRPTQFTREQMPFWVLDPVCYIDAGYPVTWIPTDGAWPVEVWRKRVIFADSVAASLDVEPFSKAG